MLHSKFGFDWSSSLKEKIFENVNGHMQKCWLKYHPISSSLTFSSGELISLDKISPFPSERNLLPDSILWHIFIFVLSTMLEIASIVSVIFFLVIKPFSSMSYKLKASGKDSYIVYKVTSMYIISVYLPLHKLFVITCICL